MKKNRSRDTRQNHQSGNPNQYKHLNSYGSDLERQKKWDEALATYRESLKVKPDQPDVLVNIAKIFEVNNNKNAAISTYQQALSIQPELAEAKPGLCSLYVGMERLDEAEPYCCEVLENLPMSDAAHYNYGRVLQHMGREKEAIPHYQKSIELNPQFPRPYYYLANIYQSLGQYKYALENYLVVTRISPEIAPAHFGAGQMYQLLRQLDQSLASYKRALKLGKTYNDKEQLVKACVQIGFIYNKLLQQKNNALPYFKMALEVDPQHAVAQHYLAAISDEPSPKQASDKFVAQLFDDMSDNFEHALVHQLHYQTPELIFKSVQAQISDNSKKLKLLDLGCGTGLCGPLFQNVSNFMTGIDLSAKMIEKAKEKNIYDQLIVGELTNTMATLKQSYDIVLAADVFVYIGDLEGVFSACNNIIVANGLFSFSIEITDIKNEQGYVLHDSGRYAHQPEYIRHLSNIFSFQITVQDKALIRREGDQSVNGYIYVLKKAAPV